MRTQEQFAAIYAQVQWWVGFHKKPVWLVAMEDKYALSVVKPTPSEIAKGTAASVYNVDMEIIDSVLNTSSPFEGKLK